MSNLCMMNARGFNRRHPSGPYASHHRLPPYLRPVPGSPLFQDEESGKTMSGVSPLNRPETRDNCPNLHITKAKRGYVPNHGPCKQPIRRYNSPNRYSYKAERTPYPNRKWVNPMLGVSPLNRPDQFATQDIINLRSANSSFKDTKDQITQIKNTPSVGAKENSKFLPHPLQNDQREITPDLSVKRGDFKSYRVTKYEDGDDDTEVDEGYQSFGEDELPLPLVSPAHTHGRRRRRLDGGRRVVEVYLVTSLARLSLESPPVGSLKNTEGCGDKRIVCVVTEREHPLDLSRKRGRDDSVITASGKRRKIETSENDSADDLSLETRVKTVKSSSVSNDDDEAISRVRRRIWRRKQGNSSKTSGSTASRRHIVRVSEAEFDFSRG